MMLFRYIIDFFALLFNKCKYQRKNFFSNLAIKFFTKYKSTNKKKSLNKTSFLDWIIGFKSFEKIVVLGSGPSLNNLIADDKTLYLTTNSSVCRVINQHFIYFTFTREYINTYLIFGFNTPTWEGSIFLFTKSKQNHKIRMKSYRKIKLYMSSYHRGKNEFLLSDFPESINSQQNFELINQFSLKILGLRYDNLNSGLSLLILGLFFAKKLNKPIEVFGIDAGSGCLSYANNLFDIPGEEVNNQRTKASLTKIFSSVDKMDIQFTNHTFFQPDLQK